ncbi:Hypothetical predicted protein [Mytilus galloprovincialis]|nr:Hypothetical predicted protein [Mytilus galloprovincialis]
MSKSLSGKVCLVTGATRGIGKGIALQLGQAGGTVYITGRTLTTDKGDPIGGSLTDTANELNSDVEELFDRISKEQDGRLDVLVNNAFNTAQGLKENMGQPFWEQPITMWDAVNNVGLR